MTYTVKQLAKLSGVSVRTLHFYDEIELLKPAYYGQNNYRYYEEAQLLMLQQILFYRELEFPLSGIQQIVCSTSFNNVEALQSHKRVLLERLDRTDQMIKTIDKTISHLRGKEKMKNEELFIGFGPQKQKEYEQYLLDSGKVTQKQIDQSWKNVKHWKKEDWDKFKNGFDQVYKELAKAVDANLDPGCAIVQELIQNIITG